MIILDFTIPNKILSKQHWDDHTYLLAKSHARAMQTDLIHENCMTLITDAANEDFSLYVTFSNHEQMSEWLKSYVELTGTMTLGMAKLMSCVKKEQKTRYSYLKDYSKLDEEAVITLSGSGDVVHISSEYQFVELPEIYFGTGEARGVAYLRDKKTGNRTSVPFDFNDVTTNDAMPLSKALTIGGELNINGMLRDCGINLSLGNCEIIAVTSGNESKHPAYWGK